MFLQRCLPLAFAAFVCPVLSAQFTATKITFRNPGALAQNDLETVAGIHAGAKISTDGIRNAAQHIIDTGYFEDVGVDTAGPASALNVIFILKPIAAERMTLAGFENFVWLSPEELAATLHQAAPLFHDRLPDAGNQIDAITHALQIALAAKGVNTEVVHETLQPSLTQPERTIEFRVERPVVRVHAITLQGVSQDLAAATTKAAASLRGSRYSEGRDGGNTRDSVLAPYFEAGYLDARLVDMHRTLVQNTATETTIDLTASIKPGEPYQVASFNYDGTPLASRDAVMATAKLKPGTVASAKLLQETLAPIDTAYRRQGYMDVWVDPGARLDPAKHTVSYTVQVTPGAQYRLRSVKVLNLSGEARKDFDANWRLKPGELYDAQYVSEFLKRNTALRSLEGYAGTFEAAADPETHQVDLTVTFARMPK